MTDTSAEHDSRHAWEQPGAVEIGRGVFRIPLPLPFDGLRAVNVYAVRDGDALVMIDAGWALAESRDRLVAGLDQLGHGLRDVRDFFVTHLHRDHYTQAVAVRREFGTSVSLGEGEQPGLAALHEVTTHPDIAALRRAGAPGLAADLAAWSAQGELDRSDWEDPDTWLTDGAELPLTKRRLRVIATPGHTRGHVVFHDPDADLLFAGDHVLPHITPSIGVELARPASPLANYLDSLRIVRALPDARLLPAHGPVTDSTHARVEELLAHHERRLTATATAVELGATSAFDVAERLTWTRREKLFDELDTLNQIFAVHETVAHLRVLVQRGWLTESTDDEDVVRYARA